MSETVTDKCNGAPVLFLDIDGTLGPDGQAVPMAEFLHWPEVCLELGILVRQCEAMIVVSSARIGQENLDGSVGQLVVPDERWRMAGECRPARMVARQSMTNKEGMIVHWLEAAEAQSIRPSHWAVLDDAMGQGAVPWQLAGRIVRPRGPLTKRDWWMLWSLLSGRPAPRGPGPVEPPR